MNFNKETKVNNTTVFLYDRVNRTGNKFEISVYRKNTFTGLGTSFLASSQYLKKKHCQVGHIPRLEDQLQLQVIGSRGEVPNVILLQ